MTIFFTKLDRKKIEVRRIPKMGRAAVDSNAIFIQDFFIPEQDRIGEEGKGFLLPPAQPQPGTNHRFSGRA
jgi:acyl-CoA dehydrogenase